MQGSFCWGERVGSGVNITIADPRRGVLAPFDRKPYAVGFPFVCAAGCAEGLLFAADRGGRLQFCGRCSHRYRRPPALGAVNSRLLPSKYSEWMTGCFPS